MPVNLYDPQIIISAAPGITNYLYLVLYEASAPNVPVANSGQLAPPHNASRQLQFIGLNPVIHLCNLFVTDGVSTTGTIIANFSIDPRYPGVEVKAPWHVYADTTPGFSSGTNEFLDPTGELDGWDYTVDIRGTGELDPATEVDKTPPGYTVNINNDGETYVFQPNEHHIIRFAPKLIIYNAPQDNGGNLFGTVEIIDADRVLDETDKGKQFIISSLTSTVRITLPIIANVPASKLFMFTSEGGNHINAVIEVEGSESEKIDWAGEQTELILGQCEHVWLYKWVDPDDATNTRWKVAHASDRILQVGEFFYFNRQTDLLNAVFADGSILDRDVYPRLWAWVQTLDVSLLVSEATWADSTNQGKFSTGDDSTTFRIPRLYAPGFLRAVDGTTRLAGSIQGEDLGSIALGKVKIEVRDGTGGTLTGTILNTGFAGQDNPAAWLSNGTGADAKYIRLTPGETSNGETIPSNHGAYLLIRT